MPQSGDLPQPQVHTVISRRSFLSLAGLVGAAAALAACGAQFDNPPATPLPPEDGEEVDLLSLPNGKEIVSMAAVIGGTHFVNGFKGTRIRPIEFPSEPNLPQVGWLRMKGALSPTPDEIQFAVYYNPERSLWMKVASGGGAAEERLKFAYSTMPLSMEAAKVDVSLQQSVKWVNKATYVTTNGTSYEMTGWVLNHSGPSMEYSIAEAIAAGDMAKVTELAEQSWYATYNTFVTKGIYQRDPNPGNILIDAKTGNAWVYDLESASLTDISRQAIDALYGRFKAKFLANIAAKYNLGPQWVESFDIVGALQRRGVPDIFAGLADMPGGQVLRNISTQAPEGALTVIEDAKIASAGDDAAAVVSSVVDDAAKAATETALPQASLTDDVAQVLKTDAVAVDMVPVVTQAGTKVRVVTWLSSNAGKILSTAGNAAFVAWGVYLTYETLEPVESSGVFALTDHGVGNKLTCDGGFKFTNGCDLAGMWGAAWELRTNRVDAIRTKQPAIWESLKNSLAPVLVVDQSDPLYTGVASVDLDRELRKYLLYNTDICGVPLAIMELLGNVPTNPPTIFVPRYNPTTKEYSVNILQQVGIVRNQNGEVMQSTTLPVANFRMNNETKVFEKSPTDFAVVFGQQQNVGQHMMNISVSEKMWKLDVSEDGLFLSMVRLT